MTRPLIIINTHPIQYFAPLYKEMAAAEMDLEIWFLNNLATPNAHDNGFGAKVIWDIPLLEGYRHRVLKSSGKAWQLISMIRALQPRSTVVVYGWGNPYFLLGLIIAKLYGHKTGLMADHPDLTELRKSPFTQRIRKWIFKNILFSVINNFYYLGKRNLQFYLNIGVSPSRLYSTPFSVDIDRFEREYAINTTAPYSLKKKEMGLSESDKIILFSGKFIEVKRVFDLLEAFRRIRQKNIALVLMGDGPLRAEIESWLQSLHVSNVFITGFVNQSRIGEYYSLADVLVMCSESETWGLSVNEAMAFHLPCIVSDTVGCAADLIIPGNTGYIFPKGDIESLQTCLETFLSLSDEAQQQMGENAREHISDYSYAQVIRGFKKSME